LPHVMMPSQMESGLASLPSMLDEIRNAPSIVQPSRFWEYFTDLNLRQLEEDGFGEFKRTINRNYFQFQLSDPRSPQYRALLRASARSPHLSALAATLAEREPTPSHPLRRLGLAVRSKNHAVYLALLWEYANRRDRRGVLPRLDEPLIGHPVYIDYRGRRVSEDMCNSVLEYTAIADAIPAQTEIHSVMELGAGYGRVAWVILSALPHVRYTIVDIPPALALAERYLSECFPNRPVFHFRHFDDYDEVAGEFEAAQILFMTPNQLELIPPQRADLFVNISSLHEMRPDQIAHYFAEIDKHCAGHFYTKQWQNSINEHDGLVVAHDDYPLPAHWRTLFDRTHPIQVEFFEALYAVGEGRATDAQ
jgi:putative sugar O-methyltransferase